MELALITLARTIGILIVGLPFLALVKGCATCVAELGQPGRMKFSESIGLWFHITYTAVPWYVYAGSVLFGWLFIWASKIQ